MIQGTYSNGTKLLFLERRRKRGGKREARCCCSDKILVSLITNIGWANWTNGSNRKFWTEQLEGNHPYVRLSMHEKNGQLATLVSNKQTSTAYPSVYKQAVVLPLLREMHIHLYNTGTVVLHCYKYKGRGKKTHCCIYSRK